MENYEHRNAMSVLKTSELQARLDEMGCRNIRFSLNYEKLNDESVPLEHRALALREDMNAVLQSYFDGNYTEITGIDEEYDEPRQEVKDIVNSVNLNDKENIMTRM